MEEAKGNQTSTFHKNSLQILKKKRLWGNIIDFHNKDNMALKEELELQFVPLKSITPK